MQCSINRRQLSFLLLLLLAIFSGCRSERITFPFYQKRTNGYVRKMSIPLDSTFTEAQVAIATDSVAVTKFRQPSKRKLDKRLLPKIACALVRQHRTQRPIAEKSSKRRLALTMMHRKPQHFQASPQAIDWVSVFIVFCLLCALGSLGLLIISIITMSGLLALVSLGIALLAFLIFALAYNSG